VNDLIEMVKRLAKEDGKKRLALHMFEKFRDGIQGVD